MRQTARQIDDMVGCLPLATTQSRLRTQDLRGGAIALAAWKQPPIVAGEPSPLLNEIAASAGLPDRRVFADPKARLERQRSDNRVDSPCG